jgi:Sec-independent protein translocase protein TatA
MKKTALTTILLVLSTLCFVLSTGVHAQSVLPLSVIPPKQEMLINPGESYSTIVKFQNQGIIPISGTLSALDFIVTDTQGTPVFLDNSTVVGTTTLPAKYSAAKWIKFYSDKMTIAANGNISVPITINVPKNAAPGGRYAAVLFEPAAGPSLGNPASAGETPISVRIASLLYIRVAGPITEKAMVTKFQLPTFLEYGPVSVATEILNLGDYHITPVGAITLKDMFGRVVASQALESKNIFPGTSRTFDSKVGDKLMFGKFTVGLAASYGSAGQVLLATGTLWIFPWKVTLAVVLALAIMIALILIGYKRFVKKEKKLVEEIKEEKTELETLKEELKDKITGEDKPKEPTPPKEKTP